MTNLVERYRTAKERRSAQAAFDKGTKDIFQQAQADRDIALAVTQEHLRIQSGEALAVPFDPKEDLEIRNRKELDHLKILVDLTGFADIFRELIGEFSDCASFDLWRVNWAAKPTERTPNQAAAAISGYIFQSSGSRSPAFPISKYLDYYDRRASMDYSVAELLTGGTSKPAPYKATILPDNSFYFLLFTPVEAVVDQPQVPRIFIGQPAQDSYYRTLSEAFGIEDIKYDFEVAQFEFVAKQHIAADPIAQAYLERRGGRGKRSFEEEVRHQRKKPKKGIELEPPVEPSRDREVPFFPSQLRVLNRLFFGGKKRRILSDLQPGDIYGRSAPFIFDEGSVEVHKHDLWEGVEAFLREIPPINERLNRLSI